jgi:hypothetical protein
LSNQILSSQLILGNSVPGKQSKTVTSTSQKRAEKKVVLRLKFRTDKFNLN